MAQDFTANFTAAGQIGNEITVRDKEQFTYIVTGTWVATWVLEKTLNGGQTFEQVDTGTGNKALTRKTANHPGGQRTNFRFRCSVFTSGIVVAQITDALDEVIRTRKDDSGKTLWEETEAGIVFLGDVSAPTINGSAAAGLDWTADQGANNINDANIIATSVTQHVALIDHDLLLNFVVNEHLDWTADQGANNINDGNIVSSSVTQHVALIDHDSLLNFVANEHVDHSSVSIATAASTSGLSGGGDLTATRNVKVDINGTTAGTVAIGDLVLITDIDDSNNLKKVTAQSIADLAAGVMPFENGYISGGKISVNSVVLTNISEITARDSTDVFNITSAGVLTPSLAVSGKDGLDTGSEAASTLYHVFVIGDTAEVNATASLLSLSPTAPTMPSGYDVFRRVGTIFNNASSNIENYTQYGNQSERLTIYEGAITPFSVLSGGSATSYTDVDCSAVIPATSRKVRMKFQYDSDGTANRLGFRKKGETGFTTTTGGAYTVAVGLNTTSNMYGDIDVPLDASGIVEYRGQVAGDTTSLWAVGYFDEL